MTVPKIWRKIPESYQLIGKKCKACGELFFPSREVCSKCSSMELEDYKFAGIGKIITFTVIRTPASDPEGENSEFSNRQIPYILAIIGLDEGPCLTAEIVDMSEHEVTIDSRVEVVFRKIVERGERGVIQYGYKFKIIRQ